MSDCHYRQVVYIVVNLYIMDTHETKHKCPIYMDSLSTMIGLGRPIDNGEVCVWKAWKEI